MISTAGVFGTAQKLGGWRIASTALNITLIYDTDFGNSWTAGIDRYKIHAMNQVEFTNAEINGCCHFNTS